MVIPNPVSSDEFDRQFFFDQKTKDIYGLINTQQAFVNPVAPSINLFTGGLTSILTQFTRWETFVDPTPPGFILTDFTAFKTNINTNLIPANNNFALHTNRLSGVTDSTASNVPNLRSIMSVGVSSLALEQQLNNQIGNPCGKLLTAFGSLFLGPDLYNELISYYNTILALIKAGDLLPAQITGDINSQVNQINSLISNDGAYFDSLVNDLLRASLAQSLGSFMYDPCGRFLLEDVISSDKLREIL
jgi:hypothetical protein